MLQSQDEKGKEIARLVGRPRVRGGDIVVEDLAHVADQQAHRQRAAHRALGQLGHLCFVLKKIEATEPAAVMGNGGMTELVQEQSTKSGDKPPGGRWCKRRALVRQGKHKTRLLRRIIL